MVVLNCQFSERNNNVNSFHVMYSSHVLATAILLLSEAAEAFRKWRGIGQKGQFCIRSKSNDFMSFTSRTKMFENMESL